MSESQASKKGVNVSVISFVTRKLIGGYKGELAKKIGGELNVKINNRINQAAGDDKEPPHVNIRGEALNIQIAEKLILQLDQKAEIIANHNFLKTTGSIEDLHFKQLELQLTPLLAQAVKELVARSPAKPNVAPAPVLKESMNAQLGTTFDAAAEKPKTETTVKVRKGDFSPIKTLNPFKPINRSQAISYLAMKDEDVSVVFLVGPAGSGKTHVPAYYAIEAYNERKIDKILLFRPRTVTGKKDMGAMKGNAAEKMSFYVKAFANKIAQITGQPMSKFKGIEAWTPDGERGETYMNSVVIVDEAQNLSEEEATMLLTRMGEGTRFIINGDISNNQNDLRGQYPGLAELLATQAGAANSYSKELREGMAFVAFTEEDTSARHKLMPHIHHAFNNASDTYKQLKSKIRRVTQNSEVAIAIAEATEYARQELDTASKHTFKRYENSAKALYPELFGIKKPDNVVQLQLRA